VVGTTRALRGHGTWRVAGRLPVVRMGWAPGRVSLMTMLLQNGHRCLPGKLYRPSATITLSLPPILRTVSMRVSAYEQDSATSGFGLIRGAASGLVKQISRPPPPAVGHPWNRKQPFDFSAIPGVDAKYISDGEIMIRSFHCPDLISGPHVTLDDYSQVSSGSQRLGEAARKQLIVHPNSKPPARDARLRNLKNCRPDLPALADERTVHVNPFSREVFAELTVGKCPADLLFPPACVFEGVGVERFVGSPVRLAVRLVIPDKVDTSCCDPTDGR
jgi:hypothetical protein